jgi:hypothetical protein
MRWLELIYCSLPGLHHLINKPEDYFLPIDGNYVRLFHVGSCSDSVFNNLEPTPLGRGSPHIERSEAIPKARLSGLFNGLL